MRNQINTNPQNWIKDWFNKTPCTLIMTFFSRGNNIRLTCEKQFKIEPWVSKIRMLRNLKIDEMFKDFEFILLSISFFILNVIFAQNISEDHSHHVKKNIQWSICVKMFALWDWPHVRCRVFDHNISAGTHMFVHKCSLWYQLMKAPPDICVGTNQSIDSEHSCYGTGSNITTCQSEAIFSLKWR